MDASRHGDTASGQQILDSSEYQLNKLVLSTGTERFAEGLTDAGMESVAALAKWTSTVLVVMLVTGMLSMALLWKRLLASLRASEQAFEDAQRELQAETERDSFRAQLSDAFEMADSEPQIHETTIRAMQELAASTPMELLLSDSSNANLERAAEHPVAGAPGCGVDTPFSCMVVRRGNSMLFPDGDTLSACPRLRGRSGGRVTAMCVPLSFMGRSLGVLHAAQPIAEPLPPGFSTRLEVLGMLAGARIGAVRAFAKTQLQAATDGLTGLPNRRTLEEMAGRLQALHKPYAFVLADLDHFKTLNDKHGHAAGDRALRQFAEVLRRSTRNGDMAARGGGEEFAVLFAGATAQAVLEIVERLRASLAVALNNSGSVVFTSSFGIADSTMAMQFEQVTRIADQALYSAKVGTRDCAVVGNPEYLSDPVVHRAETTGEWRIIGAA